MAAPQLPLDLLIVKVATLALAGSNMTQISKELDITRDQVRKIQSLPEFKTRCRELADATVATAKETLRSEVGRLGFEILRVLQANLAQNNLEAVKVAIRILGVGEAEQQTGDTHISVVLPGAQPPAIEVPSEPHGSDQ